MPAPKGYEREVSYDRETGLHVSYVPAEPSRVPQWYAEMTDPDYHKACVQARSEWLARCARARGEGQ